MLALGFLFILAQFASAFRLPRAQTSCIIPHRVALRAVNIGEYSGDIEKTSSFTHARKLFKDASRAMAISILSVFLMETSLDLAPRSPFAVAPAYADVRAQQKRTYFRFAPKLITGRDFYKNELKSAIDNGDWAVVSKFFDEYVTKTNPNDPSEIMSTDTYANNYLYRPMTLLSGTFAERGTSAKQAALQAQIDALKAAMKSLEGCVKDLPGEGFFASPIKMPTGAARTEQAKAAYAKGFEAIKTYIAVFNDGLMLELNKLDSI